MSVDKREIILEYIKTFLTSEITIANGYNITVNYTSRQLKHFDELDGEQYPALFVIDGDENITGDANQMLYRKMMPIVIGYVKATDVDTLLSTEQNKLIKATLDAIFKNWNTIKLNANVRYIKLTNIFTTKGLVYPYSAFEAHLEIEYVTELGSA